MGLLYQLAREWAVGQGDVSQWKEPGKSGFIRVTLIVHLLVSMQSLPETLSYKSKMPKSFQNSVSSNRSPLSGEQSLFIF